MAGERIVTRGLVLRRADTKEADAILTVLTADKGKLPVVAKGARGRKSRVTAATQLFAYSEMTLSESHGWQYLVEAESLRLFEGIRQDIERLSLASYFAQLVETISWDEEEAGLLPLTLNALHALDTLQRPQELVKAAFELRLTALAGFAPLLDGCPVCGKPEPEEPVLDIPEGVVRCRQCGGKTGIVPLTPAVVAAMRHVVCGEAKRLYQFSLTPPHMHLFAQAAENYAKAMVERELDTLTFYHRIKT